MYSIYKTNLLLRISIFFKDLASVDVGHIKIIDMKACCGTARAGPLPLRINYCEYIVADVASLETSEFMLKEQAPQFLRDRAAPSFRWPVQIGTMEHSWRPFACSDFRLVLVRFWCQPALCWQRVITKKCFSTSSRSRVLTRRWWSIAAKNTWHTPQLLQQMTMIAMCNGRVEFCQRSARSTRASQASPGLLESPAMCHREVVEDIAGDDCLRVMEGAMKSMVDENLRVTVDEDIGDAQVTDATPSSF